MKIGLAHNLFEPYTKGGAEKAVKQTMEELIAQGHAVFLITTNIKKGERAPSFETTTSGLKIYRLPSSYYNLNTTKKSFRLFWHLSNFFNPKRKRAFKKILKTEKPDLFVTNNLIGLGFFLIPMIKKFGAKNEHFLHDIQLLHPSGLMLQGKEKIIETIPARIYQFLTRKLFKKTDKIISPSNWLLEEHIKKDFFANCETEIRPLRKNEIFSSAIKKDNKNQQTKFLFVGQIEKHKGILFLISAFEKIKNNNISLTVIGNGQNLKEAMDLASFDKRIIFLGHAASEIVKKNMAENNCLIVPSLCYENSPTVIYEANEIGLPVIAARIGGIPEIVFDQDLLFTAGDENDLIEKIKNFKTT